MIRVIKKTPATINGKDCWEVLVENYCLGDNNACDLCCYRDYVPSLDLLVDCSVVHGCTYNPYFYFIAEPALFND